MLRTVLSLTAASLCLALASPARAEETTVVLKIATLAPAGSFWMKEFSAWGAAIEKRAPGKVKIKFMPGGIAGDERDFVRKMRTGGVQGAAVTGIGLGLIQPDVRVLDLPFLFKGYDDLDFARQTLDAELRKKFEEKGFVLLGWGDVGPVRLFSNIPLTSVDELRKTKMWLWSDDPLVGQLFKAINLTGKPLGVPDVLPSLQTGVIDAFYGSPLSTVALQWHTKVKYVTSMVFAQATGATVLSKAAWDSLGADVQKIVLEESKTLETKLLNQVRLENDKSLAKMQALGVKVVETPPGLMTDFQQAAKAAATELEGKVYTKEFRARLTTVLAERPGKK